MADDAEGAARCAHDQARQRGTDMSQTLVSNGAGLAPDSRRERLAHWCRNTGMLPLLGSMRNLMRSDFRILAYHRILDGVDPARFAFDTELVSASAAAFRRQMQQVRRDFTPIRFAQLIEHAQSGTPLPPRTVLITFDDGYDDNYRVAFPILRELGMSAMFFVSTGHIESGLPYKYDWLVHMVLAAPQDHIELPALGERWSLPSSLHERRSVAARLIDRMKALDAHAQDALVEHLERTLRMPRTFDPDCRPMRWDDLRDMQRAGMEVGSHGVYHRMLAKLPVAEMRAEVFGSKADIERELQVSADVISYPVGSRDAYGPDVEQAVQDAGYRLGCSYSTGTARLQPDIRYALPRLPVEVMGDGWFEAMMAVPEVFTYPMHRRAS